MLTHELYGTLFLLQYFLSLAAQDNRVHQRSQDTRSGICLMFLVSYLGFDKSLNIDSKNYVRSNNQPTNENEEKVEVLPSNEKTVEINKIFTVNKVLLQHENEESIFTRIPNTMGKKYMYLDKERYTQIDEETGKYIMNSNEEIPIYDKVGNFTEKLSADEIMRYWADKTKQMSKENKPKDNEKESD